ncbi:MAG: hypothetical protein ACREAT_00485, partial [Nitrosotalea sp.]
MVSFAAFVSIVGYQCLVGQGHNHDDDSANLYNFVSPTNYSGQTRTYYIASDEIKWNYAPTGINQITGVPLKDDEKSAVYTIGGEDRIGSTYIK